MGGIAARGRRRGPDHLQFPRTDRNPNTLLLSIRSGRSRPSSHRNTSHRWSTVRNLTCVGSSALHALALAGVVAFCSAACTGNGATTQDGASTSDASASGDSTPPNDSTPTPDVGPAPDAPSADAAPDVVVLTGTPIRATAALGTGEQLLGTTVNSDFVQVNGNVIFAPRQDPSGTGLLQTTVNQVETAWVQVESTTDLAANLGGWGLGMAALNASSTTRYESMRAYQIDYFEDVDLTTLVAQAPPTATYFVSKIFFGHSYEALFSGDQSTFTAALAVSLPEASGSISTTAASDNLSVTNVGHGLVPDSGDAIFAVSTADVMTNYMATGDAVPIYVEYRLIPGVSAPPGTNIPWTSSTLATIAIDQIDVFHNGTTFDSVEHSAWSISATCKVNGAVVDDNDQVWSNSSVGASGTDINPCMYSLPQDPNQMSPTSTYARYTQIPWSHSFPIASGNTLECDLSGERTDVNPNVQLPPVVIQLPAEPPCDTDGWIGNYDTGTSLDYVVHYTVTYASQ